MSALSIPTDRTAAENDDRQPAERNVAPIVAAVDGSAASRAAIAEAVRLGAELEAPIVFVFVRRGPAGVFGTPVYASSDAASRAASCARRGARSSS